MRIAAGILCLSLPAFFTWAQTRAVTDPGVITTRQTITPAGVPTVFDERVYGVAFGEDAATIWVANEKKLFQLDWRQNRLLEAITLNGLPGLQGIQFDSVAKGPLLSGVRRASTGPAHVELMDRGSVVAGDLGTYQAGAIAIAPDPDSRGRRLAVVPLTANNQLAAIDLARRELVGKAATGIAERKRSDLRTESFARLLAGEWLTMTVRRVMPGRTSSITSPGSEWAELSPQP